MPSAAFPRGLNSFLWIPDTTDGADRLGGPRHSGQRVVTVRSIRLATKGSRFAAARAVFCRVSASSQDLGLLRSSEDPSNSRIQGQEHAGQVQYDSTDDGHPMPKMAEASAHRQVALVLLCQQPSSVPLFSGAMSVSSASSTMPSGTFCSRTCILKFCKPDTVLFATCSDACQKSGHLVDPAVRIHLR